MVLHRRAARDPYICVPYIYIMLCRVVYVSHVLL
jgi:hypothetical protein